jgi:hypothetical protein
MQYNTIMYLVYDHYYSSVKAGGASEWPLLSWRSVSSFCEVLVRMMSWPGRFKVSSISLVGIFKLY